MIASRNGRLEMVRLLLQHGSQDVDATDTENITALWTACYWGHTEAARALLLEGHADPHIADDEGRTPKQIAQHMGNQACVELLEVGEWVMMMNCDAPTLHCCADILAHAASLYAYAYRWLAVVHQ